MSGFPPFSPGSKTLSHEWLNQVAKAVVERITVGGGILEKRTPTGKHFTLSDEFGTRLPRRETGLIVGDTEPPRATLTVRLVRYSDVPPKQCEQPLIACAYEFASPEFEAYPDFGSSVEDYEDYRFNVDFSNTDITKDSPFVKLYWDSRTWKVERPVAAVTGTIRFALVKAITGTTVRVQPIKMNEFFPGLWQNDGAEIDVDPQPIVSPNAYSMHLSFASLTTGVTVPIAMVGGRNTIIGPGLNFSRRTNSGFPLSECA